ncbi:MAG: DNA translocase FtsK 4TM domain-containing protein, partial [Oscillospiraceae bacterium]|nr:DNA translocase FtsK 4TM domain-containing protein [Oscillospiraceae bacterium]
MPKKQDPAKPAGHDRQDNSGRQQVTAVLLFALAVLTLCLAVIEGGSLWKALHNGLLGLFGICAALVPIVLGYISVIHSRSAQNGRSGGRFWLCTILVFMICAAFQLFITEYNKDLPFLDALSNSWKAGCEWRSGGAIGLLFGFPLVKLFDLTGAKIILSLLIFVFLMLVTGTTLIGFFRAIFKPVAKTRDTFEEVMTETGQRREEKKKQHINVVLGEGYNRWDLPLEDEKTRRRKKAEEDTEEEPFIGDLTKDFNRKTGAETDDPGDIAKTDPPPIKPTARDPFVPSLPEESTSAYRYPPVTLLDLPKQADLGRVESEQTINAGILVQTLNDFKIATRVIGVFRGPSVTR